MSNIEAEFIRLTSDIPPFCECVPFSPNAYNAISAIVLGSIYSCIEQIALLLDDEPFQYNLGLILYKELLKSSCTHYFEEYEQKYGFHVSHSGTGNPVKFGSGFRYPSLSRRIIKKANTTWADLLSKTLNKSVSRIGYIGSTTFPWSELQIQLYCRGVSLSKVETSEPINIPYLSDQEKNLFYWVEELHENIIGLLGCKVEAYGQNEVISHIEYIKSLSVIADNGIDLLVTGTLGDLPIRVVALQAQAKGIPIMMLNHGIHQNVYEEPRYHLLDHVIPDAIVDYGSVAEQRESGFFGLSHNLSGNIIKIYTRPDSFAQSLYQSGEIQPIPSLSGLRAIFLASPGWPISRFGPHRDVHPATYLAWQEKLLAWLEKQAGIKPFVRPHPKRVTTRYDPHGYTLLEGDIREVLGLADVFVVDRPSTPIMYLASTNKPILFFDPGLRRFHPMGLKAVQRRCSYAVVDIMNPSAGLSKMEEEIHKVCYHDFVKKYVLPLDQSQAEVTAVADAVTQVVL